MVVIFCEHKEKKYAVSTLLKEEKEGSSKIFVNTISFTSATCTSDTVCSRNVGKLSFSSCALEDCTKIVFKYDLLTFR